MSAIALYQRSRPDGLTGRNGCGLCIQLFSNHLEWWLGRGLQLDPYIRGALISYLRSVMVPRDLTLAPSDCFLHPNAEVFTEYTVLRGWVNQWLKYVHWYSKVAMSPDVSLEDFFKAPHSPLKVKEGSPDCRVCKMVWLQASKTIRESSPYQGRWVFSLVLCTLQHVLTAQRCLP